MEAAGQTRTRKCRNKECGVELMLGYNWTQGQAANRQYLCRDCWHEKNAKRMWVEKQYISFDHPLHKEGHYESFADCAFQNLTKKERNMEGAVYILTSESHPGWVKVGCAVDVFDRVRAYQTSSPLRDYVLLDYCVVEDRREGERDLLALFDELAMERRGEWFLISEPVAEEAFDYWKEQVCI